MKKKIINDFVKKNFLKIDYKNSKEKILLLDRGLADSAIMNSIFAFLLNKKYSFNIHLLNNFAKSNLISKIYLSFGIKNLISINIRDNFFNIKLIFFSIIEFLFSVLLIIFRGRSWFINSFSLKKIYFGDLIYDEYIRNNHNFLKRNLLNITFLKILFISIFKINFLDDLMLKKNYKYVISPTHTYASNAALGMRIALKKNIKVFNVLSSRLRVYNKSNEAEKIELALDLKFLKDKKIFDKGWQKRFNLMMKNRFEGKIKYFTAKDAYLNKKEIDKDKFLKYFNFNKNSFDRLVLFAPHCFSDANHKAGKLIFDDYYDQFQTTVKFAEKDKKSLWIIKIHPTSYRYKEENLIYDFIKNKNVKNIILSPKSISTLSLIKFTDLTITGRGTVGLESACFGKKPLLAGETFYSHKGITHNPKNVSEYISKLSNYNLSSKLDKKKILKAKKLFYLLVFKNSYIKKDKILISNYLKADIKLNKMVQQFLTVDEFVKSINNNLEKKIDISKDRIFKNFENIFINQK